MARTRKARAEKRKTDTAANVGYEAELWEMADALRNNMDAAEYKHVVLGLVFLKYISDAFEEHHAKLQAEKAQGADPEDPDEYRARHPTAPVCGDPGDIRPQVVMDRYADIDAFSEKKGRRMGNNDAWIAATTAAADAYLLTTDRDFDHLHPAFLKLELIDPVP